MTLAALVGLPIKIGPEKVERQRVVPKYSVGGKSWRGFEQDGVKMSQRTSRGGGSSGRSSAVSYLLLLCSA